ncbi:MAG: discoidin domain-containing protein [Pirellulales bacterium]|nr:discoidin domain-containing protein [Pirellulales bacterium]
MMRMSGLPTCGHVSREIVVLACVALAWSADVRRSDGASNLALNGTATASRVDFGSSVEDAIDGNRNGDFNAGSVFYANADAALPPLYFQVDLGVSAYIDRVQILRRTDADQAVFGNMRLTVYEDDGNGQPGNVAFTQDYLTGVFGSGGFGFGTWGTTDLGLNSAQGTHGRHVRLERIDNNYWLTFAEFEVIGSTSPLAFTESNNLARGKSVTVSSAPGFNSLITSGNDGNIDGNFGTAGYRPVYHSAIAGVGEYWQVDLGAMTQLNHLELFPRTDEGRSDDGDPNTPDPLYVTTSQYKVSVLDDSLATVTSFIVDNPLPSDPAPQFDHLLNTAGAVGRYIRVETTREEYLAFAELRAWQGPGSVFDPADFNRDGTVDGADLTQWNGDFGLNGDSDANEDGNSDGADFLVWQRNFSGAAVPAVASIPEPSALALFGGGLAAAAWGGRRRA